MEEQGEEREIFLAALQLDPADRDAFLRGACPDGEVRRRVEDLLRYHVELPEADQPTMLGTFRILRELGRGGMGIVYLAEDSTLNRTVALKTLHAMGPGAEISVARFFHEARAAAQLSSPRIVQVYTYGELDGGHFIAMEYVEGGTLDDWIAHAKTSMSAEERFRRAAEIVAQVGEGLEAAHAHRPPITHRDIKPSNILLDADNQPKITDFGIAKVGADLGLTEPGVLPGTPHYMSPEQASLEGIIVDHRSDIFSLGVVLFELLTLSRPFDGETPIQIIERLRTAEAPSVRSFDRSIPTDLAVICQKALEKEARSRYQAAIQMTSDLRCFLRGDPILANPPSVARRTKKYIRRHRFGVSVSGSLLLALVLGIVALTSASRLAAAREAALARVVLETDGAPLKVSAIRFDPNTMEIASVRDLGTTPLDLFLDPDQYRFVLHNGEEVIHELSAPLATPGSAFIREELASEPTDTTTGMIFIPDGSFVFGSPGKTDEFAQREMTNDAFWIDRTEVSNGEYLAFVRATGMRHPKHWQHSVPDPGTDLPFERELLELPVVGINWEEAAAYAEWRGKRLPTVFEWERATRGVDGRAYPWPAGVEPEIPSISFAEHLTVKSARDPDLRVSFPLYLRLVRPVHLEEAGTTPDGLLQAASNVHEYTEIIRREGNLAILKGAAWIYPVGAFPLDHTWTMPASTLSITRGFRCARSAAPPPIGDSQGSIRRETHNES
ncbi:MAG: bifunctional serine/threonine-protein kinase/formylglycine-generating enzyme family protein [Planctomycetota bacterium]